MEHYFTDNRHLKENRKEITFRFWCFDYSFITDNGVFSKEAIDYGTQVLLKTICEREELGERILDLGCGYGPVGVVLKKIYPTKAFEMIDVNPRAVQLAKENICRNQLEADVHVSNIYEDLHQERDVYKRQVSDIFKRNNCNITHLGVYSQHNGYSDLIIRINTFQTDALEKDLNASGYRVLSITKNPN